jgi:hypothetical protein
MAMGSQIKDKITAAHCACRERLKQSIYGPLSVADRIPR